MNRSNQKNSLPFVFFGTPDLAVTILEELKAKELVPVLIVTTPDRKQGRGMELTSPPIKVWALQHNIPILQPEKLDDNFVHTLQSTNYNLFVVAAYGKIIPQAILNIPERGTLNVHPSLLPRHRGPSPVHAQILNDDQELGVSIILLDEKMDHGPLIAQKAYTQDTLPFAWPPAYGELEDYFAHEGGALLAEVVPEWMAGDIEPQEQDDEAATYCKMITKENALIDIDDDPYQSFLKIKAYSSWPRAYFFVKKQGEQIRVVITEAEYKDDTLHILKVIPAGKKEIAYDVFLQS